ncbi:hypothetical protein ACGFT2_29070 [Streptomyces sp. NPDC048514]|uniref:hypothetical protein n=1 Tax=Streptomyces sp. NPDC048514 TaxID=3365564 RepID=UPI003714A6EF
MLAAVVAGLAGPDRAEQVAWRGYEALENAETAVRNLAAALEDSGEAPSYRYQYLDQSRREIAQIYTEFMRVAGEILSKPTA